MESIDKLRETLRKCGCSDDCYSCAVSYEFGGIADEIEREIAEKYMLLPVDAEGVPIHVGDCMLVRTIKTYVRAIGDGYWIDGTEGFTHTPEDWSHYKSRTIEDVLREFAEQAENGKYSNSVVSKYADELRSMGVRE